MANGQNLKRADGKQTPATDATATATPVELPQLVVLETNSLFIGGWPRPNAQLVNLVAWLRQYGLEIVVPEPVLREREGQINRELAQQLREAHAQLAQFKRLGAQGDVTFPTLDTLVEQARRASRAAVEQLGLVVLPHSQRSIEEMFDYAVAEEPPFKQKGTGFKDAAILLSVVDAARDRQASRVWIISNDRDFHNTRTICGDLNVKAFKFDDALSALQLAENQLKDEHVKRVVDESRERLTRAKVAIESAGSQIAQQASKTLGLPMSIVNYNPDNRVERLSFDGATAFTVEPPFEDVPVGQRVKFTCAVQLTAHVLSVDEVYPKLPVARVRVGQPVRDALEKAAIDAALSDPPEEPRIVQRTLNVFLTGTLRRSEEGYDDVQVDSMNLPTLPMSALFESMRP